MNDLPICVVDDDKSVRDATCCLLRSLGHRVSQYASADEFLASGEIESCACIISDINMPGTSGIEMRLKMEPMERCVPVILMTARPEQDLDACAAACGAVRLLRKPFEAQTLIDTLNAVLNR